REDADPDAPAAFHVARNRAARRFDLTRRQAPALGGLETEIAERHVRAARGDARVAAFLLLAELPACRLQHLLFSFAARAGRGDLAHALDGRALRRLGTTGLGRLVGTVGGGARLARRAVTPTRGRTTPVAGRTGAARAARTALLLGRGRLQGRGFA